MSSLIELLGHAITIQQQRQNREYEESMSRPLQERVAKGYTMFNLNVSIDFYYETPNQWCPPLDKSQKFIDRVYVHSENNISKFREGTSIILSHGRDRFVMEIEKDGIDDFILHSNDFEVKNNHFFWMNYPQDNWEINVHNTNITERLLKASWQRLYDNSTLQDRMTRLFNGRLSNSYSFYNYNPSDNTSQNTAIQKSLTCSNFHLIQGPPGTGKTYTIAKLVSKLVKDGKRVFVTGPTHTAINNCLSAISNELRDSRTIVKIGEKYQAEEILNNQFITRKTKLTYYSYDGSSSYNQSGFVIGATPYALCYPASKKLEGWYFDYIVIDEAAQLSIPLALAAMIYGDKLIFVGDHMQLDPIVPTETGNPLFSKSVFKWMVDKYPNDITLLDQSYRLNDELIRVPNKLFYNGKIRSVCNVSKPFVRFSCNKEPQILNHNSNEILFLHNEFDSLGRSPYEASVVAGLVSDLLDNRVPVSQIGIMSPYRAQIREIKRALAKTFGYSDEELGVFFVDTVERMQGQEKDYMIYSFANSNPMEVEDRLSFFYSPNRLNVAITRAKVKSIVIANEKIFELCQIIINSPTTSGTLKEGVKVFQDFYNKSTKIKKQPSDSEMEW